MSELATLTICQLAPLIRARDVSPVEVVREALARIERLEPRLHAFITLWPEQALAEARAAEDQIARGEYRGPLHGVPLGVKDNIALAGWPTTNGSSLMAEHVTDFDAAVVERLRAAGAVIVGKNNMHEWAMGDSCSNGPFGTVHNPWDTTRVPGGSSGGSAAAVSAALVYGSVGTDGKGSIRTPASFCGVVGFKPTFGLVSRFGELPPTSAITDHLGPIARDVADAAVLLDALAGYDPRDPTAMPSTRKDYRRELERGVVGLRVGVPQNFFFERASQEVREVVTRAIGTLGSLGAQLREVRIPSLQHMHLVEPATWNESRIYLLPLVRRGPTAFTDQSIWERLVLAQLTSGIELMQAARLRNLIRQEFLAALAEVDVLAMPTNTSVAYPIAERGALAGGMPRSHPANATQLTFPFNVTGLPALSVPCGFTQEGLPVGLMLAGRHWEDEVVLRAAYAYEQAATGGYAVPPITEC
ncbi:MAG: amidase [Chloroflexi bacterium]|nr:amidase [Chloroflexota bacterium]